MTIWADIAGASTVPVDGHSVVTLGVFDGVHRGHQKLLADVCSEADRRGVATVAMTFWPHPGAALSPGGAPAQLTTIERRVELLHAYGADQVRVLAFSATMAAWAPETFIERVVLAECGAQHVVVGENFRFGAKAAGNVEYLAQFGASHGFTAVGHQLDGDGVAFSSTRVRAAVANGQVEEAAQMLGRLPEVEGEVVHGDHRGRELGFPTANIVVEAGFAVPADGVYAGWLVRASQERLPAAISVGTNPTFEGVVGRRIESYVLDSDNLDLYGETVRIEFAHRLRAMEPFDSTEALVNQMSLDVAQTRELLASFAS